MSFVLEWIDPIEKQKRTRERVDDRRELIAKSLSTRETKWWSYTKKEKKEGKKRTDDPGDTDRKNMQVRVFALPFPHPLPFFCFFSLPPPPPPLPDCLKREPRTRLVYRMYFTRDESRLLWNSTWFRSYSVSETAWARAAADGRNRHGMARQSDCNSAPVYIYRNIHDKLVHVSFTGGGWGWRGGFACPLRNGGERREPTRNEYKLMTASGITLARRKSRKIDYGNIAKRADSALGKFVKKLL